MQYYLKRVASCVSQALKQSASEGRFSWQTHLEGTLSPEAHPAAANEAPGKHDQPYNL